MVMLKTICKKTYLRATLKTKLPLWAILTMIWMEAVENDTDNQSLPEIDRFAFPQIADIKCDIVEWWVSRQKEFPQLSPMALDYLVIPASSARESINFGS